MISPTEASAELERLSGLNFYPRGKDQTAAVKELRLAIQSAKTVDIARQAVSDILGYQTDAPTPADLRRVIWDMNERMESRVSNCTRCGGSGQEAVNILVTYNGTSLQVVSMKTLPPMSETALSEMKTKLQWLDGENSSRGDNQQIVSGARSCACRKSPQSEN